MDMHWSEKLGEAVSLEALLDVGLNLVPKLLVIIIIILLARLLLRLGYLLTNRVLKSREGKGHLEERKYETLQHLVNSILRYLVYFVAGVSILDTIGISVASVLAGAGVAGLAVSFGAQNLVRDIITGFFIIFEDQYAVGEYISVGEFSGIVEEIGLRVTKLRAFAGDLHIIPNGNITQVTNYSRGNMRALVDIPIAYEEDIDKALAVLEETSRELAAKIPEIVEGPHVLGVVDLGEVGVVLRVIAQARPMYQWGVERQLRKGYKEALAEHGIEIPYPRQVVIMAGEAKEQ
ncbi:MAG TPA: mechanosensitive ion channel family protein [Firmicutes bacterium]|nr:mechanosensitive ion channel family protein [Bacillota bacterium]